METNQARWGMWLTIILVIILVVFGIYALIKNGKDKEREETQPIDISQLVSTSTDQNSIPANWKTYSSVDYGYSIRYPENVAFKKAITVYDPKDGTPTSYGANENIRVSVEDISDVATEARNSRLSLSPLYMNIQVIKKPADFSTLKRYVNEVVDEAIVAGERSAAGVYANSAPFSQNGMDGYLVVVSDGSVIKNRDDKYFFEHGDYIYALDIAYSGYNYETKDTDEVMRVDLGRQILSSFKFNK